MAKVNPPPALRIPAKFNDDQELRSYFQQIGTILFQLWSRTGGGNDTVTDNSVDAGAADNKATQAINLLNQYIQETGVDLATTEARTNQALQALDGIAQALNLLALSPPSQVILSNADQIYPPLVPDKRTRYGYFYDTTTQTAAAINTAYAITFNSTDISNGVYIGTTTSRIYVDTEGIYNFMFSVQLDNTAGGNHLAYIWARKNGTDIAQSASQVRLKSTDGELVAAWNFLVSMKSDDYFELMWSVSDTAVQVVAQAAAAPVPAIPSVIMTVTNNL